MHDPVDLAVYVALNEEFEHIVPTLPVNYTTLEDPNISLTYYQFVICSRSNETKWRVLIVPAGAMGPPRAASVAAHVNATFRPSNIAVLGISGSLDRDLLLGDVLVPKIINNYLSVGAAAGSLSGSGWSIQASAGAYRPSSRLMNRLGQFKTIYKHQWEEWKQDTAALAQEKLGTMLPDALDAGVTRRDAALICEEANLASGELVGKSAEFVAWLKSQDRKYAAIDMETAGVFDLSDLTDNSGPRFIAVRGISDFADERKSLVEAKYKNAFRQIAIENAATFLWAAVESNLLADAAVSGPANVTQVIEIQPQFTIHIESTEIVFQHRHKSNVDLADLFVYPDMITTRSNGARSFEKTNASTLSDSANLPVKTLLIGESQSGKTSLIKTLYKSYFSAGLLPVIIDGGGIKNNDFDKALTKSLKAQYGITKKQATDSGMSLIILLDDFDKISLNKRTQHLLLDQAEQACQNLIVVGSKDLVLADTNFADFATFKIFEILPFGHARRAELIENWIKLGRESTLQEADIHKQLDVAKSHIDAMLMRNVVPAKPFFICSILQYFEVAAPSDFSLTSYGHCYQALIVHAFSKAGVGQRQLDSYVNYLTELAYYMFAAGSTSLTKDDYANFEKRYADKYISAPTGTMCDTLIRSRILSRNQGDELNFGYKYIQYFYCAKFLCDNFSEQSVRSQIDRLCADIFLEKNANVVIFMAHHSKDQRLIDEILLNTMLRFSGTKEAELSSEETAHFLEYEDMIPKLVIEQRNIQAERKKELERKDRIESHQQITSSTPSVQQGQAIDAEDRKFFSEAHSSIRSIDLLGQILRNRFGSFQKSQLRDLAEEAINVGLRLLTQHLRITSDCKEDIVSSLAEMMQRNKMLSDTQLGIDAKKLYLFACYWSTVGIIERIASTIGMSELLPIFDDIAKARPNSTAVRLVHVCIYLHAGKIIPKSLITDLYRDLESDRLGQRMLRQIVLRYLYLNHANFRDKQWLATEIDLPIKQQLLIQKSSDNKAA